MSLKPAEHLSHSDVVFGSELGWIVALAGIVTVIAITFI